MAAGVQHALGAARSLGARALAADLAHDDAAAAVDGADRAAAVAEGAAMLVDDLLHDIGVGGGRGDQRAVR